MRPLHTYIDVMYPLSACTISAFYRMPADPMNTSLTISPEAVTACTRSIPRLIQVVRNWLLCTYCRPVPDLHGRVTWPQPSIHTSAPFLPTAADTIKAYIDVMYLLPARTVSALYSTLAVPICTSFTILPYCGCYHLRMIVGHGRYPYHMDEFSGGIVGLY